MFRRPPLRPFMAMRKPSPSSPRRSATGTRTSSKITWRVGWVCQPIFFSLGPKDRPGVSLWTTTAEIPRAPVSAVRHMTT